MEGNILLKECTQMINNRIKLHILGVPIRQLANAAHEHSKYVEKCVCLLDLHRSYSSDICYEVSRQVRVIHQDTAEEK